MRRAADIEDFLSAPADSYVRGSSFVFFFDAQAGLYGTLLAGCLSEDDARTLCRCYPREVRPGLDRPYPSLFDASGLDGLDASGFSVMLDYFTSFSAVHAELVTKVAIVHGAGLAGATVAGFAQVVGLRAPARLFSSRADALAWLVGDDPCIASSLDALARSLVTEDALVARLRGCLAANLKQASLSQTARALGVSVRTLQRSLQDAGTTFQAEHTHARLSAAKRLLIETDQKLAAIGHAVGCATPQQFSEWFRKHTAASPSAWRRERGLRG
ncbi:MAG: helix-turn-helix transcriptional regulator [Polyangiaceae bacterium]